MYIKALEQEVLRLKELYGSSTRDRESVELENQKLKQLLAAHGIAYDGNSSGAGYQNMAPQSWNGTSSGSISGSYRDATNTSGFSPPALRSHESSSMDAQPTMMAGQLPNNNLDFDQIGIDFVLTYENTPGQSNRAAYPSPPPNQ